MSLVSIAIDGFLQRNPAILRPILTVPTRTESTRGPYPHKSFPKSATYESGRRLMGSGNLDEFEDQRFTRGPARLAGSGRAPIKTFMGLGGQNPVYVEPEIHIKSYNAPVDYGNLLPRAPVKTYEREPVGLRSPVKTY